MSYAHTVLRSKYLIIIHCAINSSFFMQNAKTHNIKFQTNNAVLRKLKAFPHEIHILLPNCSTNFFYIFFVSRNGLPLVAILPEWSTEPAAAAAGGAGRDVGADAAGGGGEGGQGGGGHRGQRRGQQGH